MQILRHKNFKKRYEKLDKFLKNKVNSTIEKFYLNPHDPSLKNHALQGSIMRIKIFRQRREWHL